MFDTQKNLSIALSRIKRSFWCLFQTLCDDDRNNETDENENDCSNETDENSRISKSKKSVSLERSREDCWENKLEIINENNLKKEKLEL